MLLLNCFPCFLLFFFSIAARDYEIVRNQVELGEIIGEGQFGNVHKGSYKGRDGQSIAVAVKTCKVDADSATADKFLEEACECSENKRKDSVPVRLVTLLTLLIIHRYNATIRASLYNKTDRCVLRSADLAGYGTG